MRSGADTIHMPAPRSISDRYRPNEADLSPGIADSEGRLFAQKVRARLARDRALNHTVGGTAPHLHGSHPEMRSLIEAVLDVDGDVPDYAFEVGAGVAHLMARHSLQPGTQLWTISAELAAAGHTPARRRAWIRHLADPDTPTVDRIRLLDAVCPDLNTNRLGWNQLLTDLENLANGHNEIVLEVWATTDPEAGH